MNPASDTETPPPVEKTGGERDVEPATPTSWREAVLDLISARVSLIQLESKEAASQAARRAVCLAAVAFFAVFAWALLLAGGISAISHASGWSWYWIALIAGAIHLLAGMIFANCAKKPASPTFPVTRAEFQKDREWIENLHKTRKSND